MLLNNRIIWKDNAQLKDLSLNLSNFLSGVVQTGIVATEDALYIGSDLPFNHRWFEVSTVNDQASVLSIDIWDGNAWIPAVDVIDQTSASGKTFAQSGIISWVPDRYKSWGHENSSEDVDDLETLKIYNMFWVRIRFSGDLKATTALKYVGHKFSSDEDLAAEYPELANQSLKTSFQAGKTTWDEQHFLASEYIVQQLRAENIVYSENQIVDWQQFKSSSVHKVAEICFRAFGEDYFEELKVAQNAFGKAMATKSVNIDRNKNATIDTNEKDVSTRFLSR